MVVYNPRARILNFLILGNPHLWCSPATATTCPPGFLLPLFMPLILSPYLVPSAHQLLPIGSTHYLSHLLHTIIYCKSLLFTLSPNVGSWPKTSTIASTDAAEFFLYLILRSRTHLVGHIYPKATLGMVSRLHLAHYIVKMLTQHTLHHFGSVFCSGLKLVLRVQIFRHPIGREQHRMLVMSKC